MNNFEETPYVLVLDGRDTDRDATRLLVATYASMPDFMGSCIQQNKTRQNKEVYRDPVSGWGGVASAASAVSAAAAAVYEAEADREQRAE